jgi:hypothetical protein
MYKIKGADQQEYGPATAEQVRQWIAERRANQYTLVQFEGTPEWKPLSAYPEFDQALRQTAGPPPVATLPGPVSTPGVERVNPMAVTGIVLGAISLLGSWVCCCGFPLSILGIVFSAVALHQISVDPLAGSRTQALIGLALSIVGLLGSIVFSILGTVLSRGQDLQRMFQW